MRGTGGLFYQHLVCFRALTTDVDIAGGGVGYAYALKVEVLDGSIGVDSHVVDSGRCVEISFAGVAKRQDSLPSIRNRIHR